MTIQQVPLELVAFLALWDTSFLNSMAYWSCLHPGDYDHDR